MAFPQPSPAVYSEKVHELEARLHEGSGSTLKPEEKPREPPAAAPKGGTQQTALPQPDEELYEEKVHELEENSPRGFLEFEEYKTGRKPELKMRPPHTAS